MKVKVYQVGYTTQRDYLLHENAKYREMGFVEIPENIEGWEEKVWDLLNWSCWTDVKPTNVKSPLDHCNSDVILQIDGSCTYRYAKFVGWGEASSLIEALEGIQQAGEFWPFYDSRCSFKDGLTKVENGKAYWMSPKDYKAGRNHWIEVTW